MEIPCHCGFGVAEACLVLLGSSGGLQPLTSQVAAISADLQLENGDGSSQGKTEKDPKVTHITAIGSDVGDMALSAAKEDGKFSL